jgi:hypothetical protein
MSRVGGALASPALRGVLERALLSAAPAPDGDAGGKGDFLAARVGALMTLGRPEKVLDLLERIPRAAQGEAVMRDRLEALLVRGLYDEACRIVRQEIVAYHAEVFWGQALIFCQIRNDEIDQAMLGLDLLRESGAEDPLFSALSHHYAGGAKEESPVQDANALHLAMMRLTDFPVPPAFVEASPAYLWPALVVGANLQTDLRTGLAERAAAAGVIPGDVLAATYGGVPLSDKDRSMALAVEPAQSGVRHRAALFQLAESGTLDIGRAEALGRLLQSARVAGLYQAVLPAVLPLLESLQPRVDLAWFAGTPARAFYLVGQLERARSWHRLVGRADPGTDANPAAEEDLRPVLLLQGAVADPAMKFPELSESHLIAAEEDSGSDRMEQQRAVALMTVLRALGKPTSDDWAVLAVEKGLSVSENVNSALFLALREAVKHRRTGEGLLAVAAMIDPPSLSDLAAVEIDTMLTGLAAFELAEEARLIGVEIALAHGY